MLAFGFIAEVGRPATFGQIVAVLPTSLKPARLDFAAMERYRRLVDLAAKTYPPVVAQAKAATADTATRRNGASAGRPLFVGLEPLLGGPLRAPLKGGDNFPEYAKLKALAKLLSLVTVDAAERGDRAVCARYAFAGLSLSNRLIAAQGDPVFLAMSTQLESIASRACFEADCRGALDERTRARVLARLTPVGRAMPEVVAALRTEFYAMRVPILLDPVHGWKAAYGETIPGAYATEARMVDHFDPIATARLMGGVYDAAILDVRTPLANGRKRMTSVLAPLGGALDPERITKPQVDKGVAASANGFGAYLARVLTPELLPEIGQYRATRRSLVWAALVLRHGGQARLPYPFGKGDLRIDPKRRIVCPSGRTVGTMAEASGREGVARRWIWAIVTER